MSLGPTDDDAADGLEKCTVQCRKYLYNKLSYDNISIEKWLRNYYLKYTEYHCLCVLKRKKYFLLFCLLNYSV